METCLQLADSPVEELLCTKLQELVDTPGLTGDGLDVLFMLWGSEMVFFMLCGFAMLSAGAVRTKNTTNILLSIFCISGVACVGWFITGYGFAYGKSQGGFIGSGYYFGMDLHVKTPNMTDAPNGLISHWLFQATFSAVAAVIVSGAVAERATFEAYLVYSFVLSTIVFPTVAHWVWGGGFLSIIGADPVLGVGAIDLAGCGPCHILGGLVGAIGTYIVGPRIGRFDEEGFPTPIYGHSSTLVTLGTMLLWVGWFGFNCASLSTLQDGPGAVSRAAANTLLASAGGATSSLAISTLTHPRRKWQPVFAMNGLLSGLVSITAGCSSVDLWAAFVIGFVGGILYLFAISVNLVLLQLDDPLEAVAVHLWCGIWGLLAVGLFARSTYVVASYPGIVYIDSSTATYTSDELLAKYSGVFMGGDGVLLACQLLEILCVSTWSAIWAVCIFLSLSRFQLLRVTLQEERTGIDQETHGIVAYPESADDSVHHYGSGNEYSESSVVERTPTGKLVVKRKSSTSSSGGVMNSILEEGKKEYDHSNVVFENDGPDEPGVPGDIWSRPPSVSSYNSMKTITETLSARSILQQVSEGEEEGDEESRKHEQLTQT